MNKINGDVKTVNAADLAKALKIKTDVRAGAFLPPTGCRACGLGGGGGGTTLKA